MHLINLINCQLQQNDVSNRNWWKKAENGGNWHALSLNEPDSSGQLGLDSDEVTKIRPNGDEAFGVKWLNGV